MQTKAACIPWLHANHGWPTLIPYIVVIISDGIKRAENTQIWWGWVKIGEKLPKNDKRGLIFWGKVQNSRRSTPINRCFQPANFDTPHGHHEFCMQFWPTRTDSHAVLHFKELWWWVLVARATKTGKYDPCENIFYCPFVMYNTLTINLEFS